MLNEERLHQIISEEITKTEVTKIVNDKIASEFGSSGFESKVREIVADVIENLYRTLWNRSSVWKGQVKR